MAMPQTRLQMRSIDGEENDGRVECAVQSLTSERGRALAQLGLAATCLLFLTRNPGRLGIGKNKEHAASYTGP